MGDYLTKNHSPHHHREICATYLYMANSLLKIDHKILHKWANDVLTPIHTVISTPVHTVAIRQNCNVMQGCDNVVRTYVWTHKYQNSNLVRMEGVVCESLSVKKTARRVAVP